MNTNKKTPINRSEDEIDAIRIALYEQIKDMTAQERVNFFSQGARDILEKQGIKARFVKSTDNDTPVSHP